MIVGRRRYQLALELRSVVVVLATARCWCIVYVPRPAPPPEFASWGRGLVMGIVNTGDGGRVGRA